MPGASFRQLVKINEDLFCGEFFEVNTKLWWMHSAESIIAMRLAHCLSPMCVRMRWILSIKYFYGMDSEFLEFIIKLNLNQLGSILQFRNRDLLALHCVQLIQTQIVDRIHDDLDWSSVSVDITMLHHRKMVHVIYLLIKHIPLQPINFFTHFINIYIQSAFASETKWFR